MVIKHIGYIVKRITLNGFQQLFNTLVIATSAQKTFQYNKEMAFNFLKYFSSATINR
jgi:hypothetical protein